MKRAVIFILSIFPLFVQSEPPRTFRDRLRTSDALFWKNEVYHIDRSPLERFHGFDTLFSDYPEKGGFSIPGLPLPKGYFAIGRSATLRQTLLRHLENIRRHVVCQ